MKYRSVLFDLDGTLVDNSEGIMNGFRYALEKLGRLDELDKIDADVIGPPLRLTFEKIFRMDAHQVEEAVRLYREFFGPTGLYQCSMYPGVPELLAKLDDAGAVLVLATSKARVFAEKILGHTGMAKHFDAVVGCELDGSLDNKSDIIAHILETKLKPGDLPAVMVGDRYHDAEGAQHCGVDFAAALWGFGCAEEFAPYSCVKGTFESAAALADWLMGE